MSRQTWNPVLPSVKVYFQFKSHTRTLTQASLSLVGVLTSGLDHCAPSHIHMNFLSDSMNIHIFHTYETASGGKAKKTCVISHNPFPETKQNQRKEWNLLQLGVVMIKLLHIDMTIAALYVSSEELNVFRHSLNLKCGGDTRIINLWIFSPI